jgi:coenzyme F420-reducing hydrogenase delta subunit
MDHMGIARDRLHFSWISSAESTKFVEVVNQVTSAIKGLGPIDRFVKKTAKVA